MKKHIYYPSLEPPNLTWLKFALLYMDRCESIVPYDRQNEISEQCRIIEAETDLLAFYSPTYMQGESAAHSAIDEITKYLNDPHRYANITGHANAARVWRDQKNWDYLIYKGKFTDTWRYFCEHQGIGLDVGKGVMLSKDVGFIFMTFLASEIAHERNGIITTDNTEYDDFLNFTHSVDHNEINVETFLKGVIQFQVPIDIAEIEMGRLIEFRNTNRKRIAAFNTCISRVEDSISNGLKREEFIEEMISAYKDLGSEILQLGVGVVSIPVSSYIVLSNPEAMNTEYLDEILGGGLLMYGGITGIRNSLKKIENKTACRKYLMNLRRFK